MITLVSYESIVNPKKLKFSTPSIFIPSIISTLTIF